MKTNADFDRHASAWLADGPTELSDRVLDDALREVHVTHQRRVRVPWRFPLMPALSRTTAMAGAVLVAVVGAGTFFYLTSNRPGGPGSPSTSAPTTAPTSAATVAPTSSLPPGITGWTTYASAVHGFAMGYPADWSLHSPATRTWQAGDRFPGGDVWPYADSFESPEADTVGLFVWEMPAGEGADIESTHGLKAWAGTFCNNVIGSACDTFTERAVPMHLRSGCSCPGAILVPTASAQYAFVMNWSSVMLTGLPDRVRVVVIAREDTFPSAARYGGSVELLKSILTTMDVWTPGQQPPE